MTCDTCGRPCHGNQCADCRREQHLEDFYGVPSDYVDDEEAGDE